MLRQLDYAIEKYNIPPKNMYNQDEKGFIIRVTNQTQRIMSLKAIRAGWIQFALTDGNCKFVTLLACICADGTKIPIGLIYKGESHDL